MAIVAPIVSTFDSRGVRQAGRAFDGMRRQVGSALRAATKAATVFGVAASAGIVKSVSAASDLNEAISATEQIFGDAADDVLAFSRTAAKSIGQSQQTVLDAAMTFGTFGKAAGLAGDDLSTFTNEFVTLASDIASFRNAAPEEVIEAIGAGLRGESEPLRRFGVLLDDATLKAEALALGIYDGTGALSQQQKILAAEAAIYKQTTDAQGDFARTSDGLANSSRILRARLDNVTAQIGQAFLPAAVSIASTFLDRVIPAVEAVADKFTEEGIIGVLRLFRDWIRENFPSLASSLYDWITAAVPLAVTQLGKWIAGIATWIRENYQTMVDAFLEFAGATWSWITDDVIPELGKWIKGIADWIIENKEEMANAFAAFTSATWDWLTADVIPEISKWIEAIAEWIKTDGRPAMSEAFMGLRGALVDWILGAEADEETQEAVGGFVGALGKLIKESILTSVEFNNQIYNGLLDTFVAAGARVAKELGLDEDLADAFAKNWRTILSDSLSTAWDNLVKAWTWSTDSLEEMFDRAKEIGTYIGDGIAQGIRDAAGAVSGAIVDAIPGGSALGGLWGFLTGAADFIGIGGGSNDSGAQPSGSSYTGSPFFIPAMAKGGIVRKPTLAMIGEAGPEAVVPLNRGGMGGVTININGAIDPVTTAQQIREILNRDASRFGRVTVV